MFTGFSLKNSRRRNEKYSPKVIEFFYVLLNSVLSLTKNKSLLNVTFFSGETGVVPLALNSKIFNKAGKNTAWQLNSLR
jgi:hypothetical protein